MPRLRSFLPSVEQLDARLVPTNSPPVAVADFGVTHGAAIKIYVLDNDSDPDSDTLSIINISTPTYGTVENFGTYILYTPTGTGPVFDEFTYTIGDGHEGSSSGGTSFASVGINLLANNAPEALDDERTSYEHSMAIDVLRNDSDGDGDSLTVTSVSTPTYGSATIIDGVIWYTPDPEAMAMTASFEYEISDGHGGTSMANMLVNLANAEDQPFIDWANATPTGDAHDLTNFGFGPGHTYIVYVDGAEPIIVWRPDDIIMDEEKRYWCHGFTFGGDVADGGPYSIYSGEDVEIVLAAGGWTEVAQINAQEEDIVVFYDQEVGAWHSAILNHVVLDDIFLDDTATFDSKNGPQPFSNEVTLEELITAYGGTFKVFHRN